MSNEVATVTPFKIPDRDKLAKVSGKVFKIAVIAGALLAVWAFVLPYLLAIAIGSVEFFVVAAIGVFLGFIFFNPKFWRAMNYACQFLVEKILGFAIEMNPLKVMRMAIDKKEQELEVVHTQNANILGQMKQRGAELASNNKEMQIAASSIETLKQKIQGAKTQEDQDQYVLQLTSVQADFSNAKDFIDEIQPLYNDLSVMAKVTSKIFNQGTVMIKVLRGNIDNLEKRRDASNAGSKAMAAARAALGNGGDLNQDALQARAFVEKDIAQKLGLITQGIQATADFMNAKDLRDASKVQLAVKNIELLKIDENFNYSDTIKGGNVQLNDSQQKALTGGNQYIDLLK